MKLCTFIVTLFAFQQAGAQCNADFSFAVNDSTRIVQFTNLSTPAGDSSYQWFFGGGGGSSFVKNPSHQFPSPGTYMVCLYYFAPGCWDSTCKMVTIDSIVPGCQTNFSYSVNHSTKTVTFSNLSGSTDSSYLWRFGDATTSGVKNPVHTYPNPGTYTVCLKRLGPVCFDSICKTVTINNACNLNFTYSTSGKTVTFNNTSVGDSSYTWRFGDATSSGIKNPSHTYANNGVYTVCLKRNGPVCFDSICKTVQVFDSCNANFTYSITPGTRTVTFTNLSTGGDDSSYYWYLGGTGISYQKNPVHTFPSAGTYLVCLSQMGYCQDSVCKLITINPTDTCIANFNYWIDTATNTVHFNNTSSSPDSSYQWFFGDNTGSGIKNPTHTYAGPGTYLVCLLKMSPCFDSICKQVVIPGSPCNAGFNYFVDSFSHTVFFYNTSTGPDSSYYWNFGDNTGSGYKNPSHLYPGPGTYLVCLTKLSPCFDSICKLVVIPGSPCNANFSYGIDTFANTVYFYNTSTGPDSSYYWTFGDNTGSGVKNPSHVYPGPGSYLVCLIKLNPCFDSICKLVVIPGSPCNAGFNYWIDTASNTVHFNNTSTGPDSSYYWSFGDNTTSGVKNPVHTYPGAGTYLVCLLKMSPCFDSVCKLVVIPGSSPCNAEFSYSVDPVTRTVTFTNLSTGGNDSSYFWYFGGTGISNLENPTHTFPSAGTYLVCLSIFGNCNDSVCKLIVIANDTTAGCHADFDFTVYPDSIDEIRRIAVFSNLSSGVMVSNFWSFGDGDYSTQPSPIHYYPVNGTYTVCLAITDTIAMCSDSVCKTIYIGPDSTTGMAHIATGINHLNIYPVPFNESMKIQFESVDDKPVSIRIYNALGMLQVSETRQAIAGVNEYEVNAERLARGVYFIELSTERGTITRRTVK